MAEPFVQGVARWTPQREALGEEIHSTKCVQSAQRGKDVMWDRVRKEAAAMQQEEPALARYFETTVLQYGTLECVLIHHLSNKLGNHSVTAKEWFGLLDSVMAQYRERLGTLLRADLAAIIDRDPACEGAAHALLNFKGYLALQASRIANMMWHNKRRALSLAIQSRVSEVFGVDIHPACSIGSGVLLDHATAIVFGETAVVGDDCTILHGVTLGGTGKERGDRHPKLGRGILIGAGALILGNITIGDGCKIAAGSVVLKSLPAHTTAAGVPAKVVGVAIEASPSLEVDQNLKQVLFNPGERHAYQHVCSEAWSGCGAADGEGGGCGGGTAAAAADKDSGTSAVAPPPSLARARL